MPRSARIVRIDTPPEIDGVLDDPVWSGIEPLGALVQVDPDEGAAPTERTEIRIAYDDENLYVGVRMYDRDPSALIAKQMVLDTSLFSDDRINLIFDTFNDHRNGYFFQINPAGTRSDALLENNDVFRRDWNGIWYADATVDEQGWSAEFAIPFQTVSMSLRKGRWGFEAERIIRRKNEKARWANPSRNRSITDVAGIGELLGLRDVDATGVDLVPNASLGHDWNRFFVPALGRDIEHSDAITEPGGDVFWKFHPSVTVGVTANTNFLESPRDDLRTELTRFPPSFPERRDFFLQDAGIFEFGDLAGNGIPFFSRTIGRQNGQPLDIDAGLKLTGRLGRLSFGGLGVTMPAQNGLPRTTVGVARMQLNVLGESAIGLIGTYGDPRGQIDNGLVGADFQYFNSRLDGGNILRGSAFVMKSFSDPGVGDEFAYGARIEYPNDRYNGRLGYTGIGQGFDPRLGFANRRGIHQFDGSFRKRWRPNTWLRTVDSEVAVNAVFDSDLDLETAVVTWTPVTFTNQFGDSLRFQYSLNEQRLLRRPFEVDQGVFIPLGDYTYHRGGIKLETASFRPVRVVGELIYGSFYSGTLFQGIVALELRPSRYFFASAEYEQDEGRLPQGDFTKRLARLRVNLALNPRISWSNTLQYERSRRLMELSSIFRWEIEPGRNLYLVVTQQWLEGGGTFRPFSASQVGKLVYTFRF